MSAEVRNALTQALADGLYLRLDTTNDPLTGDLDMGEFDILNADVIYGGTTVVSGLTIAANTQATTTYPLAGIVTEGWLGLYPDIPNTLAFASTHPIDFSPTVTIAPVSNISVIRETGSYVLTGLFSSFSIITAAGTINVGSATAGAGYLFVSQLTSKSDTIGWPPATIRSFDHRGILEADGAAVGTTSGQWGLLDIGICRSVNSGVMTVDYWVTAGNASVPGLGQVSATAGAVCTVSDRIVFHAVDTTLAVAGGTETITRQYGLLVEPMLSGVSNYGISLLGDDADGSAIWFGAGHDAKSWYDGTNLIVEPQITGSGIVLIGTTGNRDMRLTNIEIDGALNHDGSTAGFFNVVPVVQQTAPAATTPSNLQAGDYGELYVEANATPTVIAVQNTWYQVTIFTAAGQSRGSVVSAANDDITIATTGIYQIMVSTSFTGGAGKTYEIEVQKNNGANRLINLHGERRVSAGGDMASMSISGLASLTSTDTIELWIRGLDVITANATLRDVNISLIEIGTFAGESATETDILALATETNAHRTNLINLGLQV